MNMNKEVNHLKLTIQFKSHLLVNVLNSKEKTEKHLATTKSLVLMNFGILPF